MASDFESQLPPVADPIASLECGSAGVKGLDRPGELGSEDRTLGRLQPRRNRASVP